MKKALSRYRLRALYEKVVYYGLGGFGSEPIDLL